VNALLFFYFYWFIALTYGCYKFSNVILSTIHLKVEVGIVPKPTFPD